MQKREDNMTRHYRSIRNALLAASMLASPAFAADVTPERLINSDKEPQNWLMNHRTYDGQRFSPLARINKDNVKGLRLAYAVPLAGSRGREFIEATPLAEDGFLYITDSWGVLYKIDATAGDAGRIVWRMEPMQERQVANRGAALWGNFVISPASTPARIIATDKTSGKVAWETNVSRRRSRSRAPASHQRQDHYRSLWRRWRRARLDGGARRSDRQASVTQIHHSGTRRARQRNLE